MAAAVPESAGEGELSGGCVQEMEAEAQGMRTRLDGMPGAGRDTARLARSVERVEETRKMWNDQLDRCGELRIELVAELAKIQHPLAQEVLRRRYMNGESYARDLRRAGPGGAPRLPAAPPGCEPRCASRRTEGERNSVRFQRDFIAKYN